MSFTFDTTPGPAIHRAAKSLKQALSSQLKSFDITPEQFSVLMRLWQADGLTRRQRADRLQKDKANVTRILDRRAAKGLRARAYAGLSLPERERLVAAAAGRGRE